MCAADDLAGVFGQHAQHVADKRLEATAQRGGLQFAGARVKPPLADPYPRTAADSHDALQRT
jgi:hypothetical protein